MADIAVELTLLPAEHGGRRTLASQGYRPQFYYNNSDWDARYEYDVPEVVPQGQPVTARLAFLSPEEHWGKLFVGMPFLLREGNRVVGYGRVTALLDLEASARKARGETGPVARADQPRDSSTNVVQRAAPVNPPLSMSLAGRRTPEMVFRHQRDEWIGFLRQQGKQLRLWLDTSCGLHHFTAFMQRQGEKLSRWFDAACDDVPRSLRRQGQKLRVWSAGIARCLSVLRGWISLPMLPGWCCFAAAVLLVSLVVHASTFLGIDPMAKWPGVMLIHLAVFLPFIAAGSYASRAGGKEGQGRIFKSAPRWLRILSGVFLAYALVNFAIFLFLCQGGSPHERDGKYLLTSHGKVFRELSEAEFHQQQAYVVRGFSGHWMAFSGIALTMLVGTLKLRRPSAGPAMPALAARTESAPAWSSSASDQCRK